MPEPLRVFFTQASSGRTAKHSGDVAVPPAGVLAVAGYCRPRFPDAVFAMRDFQAEKTPPDEQIRILRNFRPDIVAMGARSFLYPASVRLAETIKSVLPQTRVVFGGQHPTLLPEDAAYPACFDCVIRGEGETGFAEVLRRVEAGEDLPRVLTPRFLDEEEITHDMAWDLVEHPEAYARPYSPFYPDPMGSVVWSRGCPFRCAYCAGPALWIGSRPRVRYRHVDSILRELRYLKSRFGIRRLFVHDDTLNANLGKMMPIVEAVAAADLDIRWYATGLRADESMTPQHIFPALRRAGCRVVNFGIESGSRRVLDGIHRHMSFEEIERALRVAGEAGLRTGGTFTMGHIWRNPDGSLGAETEEDLARTVDCIRRLVGRGLLWSAQICIIDPVPGSEVGNLVQEHRLQETQDFDDLLQFDRIRLNFRHPTLDAATLDDYYTRGYRAAVLNPRLWWTALRQIEEPCELYALIRLFVFMLRKRLFRIDR